MICPKKKRDIKFKAKISEKSFKKWKETTRDWLEIKRIYNSPLDRKDKMLSLAKQTSTNREKRNGSSSVGKKIKWKQSIERDRYK